MALNNKYQAQATADVVGSARSCGLHWGALAHSSRCDMVCTNPQLHILCCVIPGFHRCFASLLFHTQSVHTPSGCPREVVATNEASSGYDSSVQPYRSSALFHASLQMLGLAPCLVIWLFPGSWFLISAHLGTLVNLLRSMFVLGDDGAKHRGSG